jgi:hypothetical protein
MNLAKIISKFENYWLNDSNFRLLIFSNIDIHSEEMRVYFEKQFRSIYIDKNIKNQYVDLNIESSNLFGFLVGFFFPQRDLTYFGESTRKFRDLGQKLGAEGKVWQVMKWSLNLPIPVRSWDISSELNLVHAEAYAFACGSQNPEIIKNHLLEQNFFRAGQDICHPQMRKTLQTLISNDK